VFLILFGNLPSSYFTQNSLTCPPPGLFPTVKGEKVKLSRYRRGQALGVPGGWGFRISRQLAYEGGKAVSPTHRPSLPPGRIPGTHFCQRLSRPQGYNATGRIKSLKNSSDPIGNRTRDLPAGIFYIFRPILKMLSERSSTKFTSLHWVTRHRNTESNNLLEGGRVGGGGLNEFLSVFSTIFPPILVEFGRRNLSVCLSVPLLNIWWVR
jgi:hypothetical protein